MQEQLTGRVYDIQGFSVQDGPGIRTTAFLKGCPLRCPWCHSPESQAFHPQLSWIAMRCIGVKQCGRCLTACPKGAVMPGAVTQHSATGEDMQLVRIDRGLCDNCGSCATACRPNALYICGQDYTVQELVERVCKDKPFYQHSGGGVTISGGEPLWQPEFTTAVLWALKERDIHTALDTTGFVGPPHIEAVVPCTDLFLYDLKHMDSDAHKAVTGVPNEQILENAQRIAAAGGKMQIRVPIIPHFNDSEENIRRVGTFCRTLGEAVTVIQLLPYHSLGVVKYQRIDDTKKVLEVAPPPEEQVEALREILDSYSLAVTVH